MNNLKSIYTPGKIVKLNGTPNVRSYNMWLNLVKKYPSLVRPCHLKFDVLLEVVQVVSEEYVIVRQVEDKTKISILLYSDLPIVGKTK